MSTIVIKNSNTPGNQPSSLAQGELAINTADGKVFYGDGGSVIEFTGTPIDTSSFATTGSNTFRGDQTVTGSVDVEGSKTQTGNSKIFGNLTITGSLTTSGSNKLIGTTSLTGSVSITGSTTQTGNNTLIGNTVLSGSIGISGSSTIQGTTTMTGSLSITGSTTQIGSNTLQGNTTLSGSIIISGSNPPGSVTASVQIYGDIRQSGYHRFDPVTTNIDTSITASYIYVSGSTQDLYFSQNGSGYNNVTRLRWLEGGSLYTGLLRGGIISSTPGTTTFKISSGSGLLVTMNASTASEPYPTVQYITWPDYNAQPIINSGSAKITYVGINSLGQVVQQVVPWGTNDINQWDNSISLGVVLTLSGSVSTGVFNAPQISYGGQQKNDDFFRAFGPLKVSGHTLRASGSTLSIIKDAGTSYREGANYVINANHPSTVVENSINVSKIYRYHLSGSTPVIDTGVGAAGYTVIDPSKYVDTTTGLLDTVTGGQYSLQRVFWVPNSPTNAFIIYYGNAKYNSLLDAIQAKDTEPFTEAPNTAQNAIFLGYIAIKGGASSLTNASDASIILAGIFRSVGGVGASGTNFVSTTLAGLADVSLSGNTPGDLLVYGTGTFWNNKKQLTGSYGLTGSLVVTQNISASSFTGSLLGTATTASYVTGSIHGSTNPALSASYAATASLAPNYVLNSVTSSFVLNSQTSSFVTNNQTSSFATTGSNTFNGNQIITGSLNVSSSLTTRTIIATSLPAGTVSSMLGIDSSNNIITAPGWVDYSGTSTIQGFSSYVAGGKNLQYQIVGKTMYVQFDLRSATNAGSGSVTNVTIPNNASAWAGTQVGMCRTQNTTTQNVGMYQIVAGSNQLNFYTTSNNGTLAGWTDAGTRQIQGFATINIA